jgi:hypothetical protein
MIALQSLLASGLVGAALELADSLLHLFARFEGDHKLFGDKDFLTGARVTRLASGNTLLTARPTPCLSARQITVTRDGLGQAPNAPN